MRVLAVVLVLLAGARAADLKRAFRPLPLPKPAKLRKQLEPRLPGGIVIEAAPFDTLIERQLKALEPQLEARERALAHVKDRKQVRYAVQVLAKEDADLRRRIAGVEEEYSEVYNRGYMESSESARRTRKLAAVLIPLYRRLLQRNEALLEPAASALARADAKWLAGAARSDPTPLVRAVAVDALAEAGGDQACTALREVLARDKDPSLRLRALGALLAWKLSEVEEAVIAALQDEAWRVRALAVAVCVRGELIEAAGPLIERLAKEEGRLRRDIDDALHALTKAQFFGDVELWRRWWAENRARVEQEAAQRKRDQVLGPPRSWKRGAAGESDDEKRKGETSAFYGIPTVSKRIVYVIDISRSMQDRAEATPTVTSRRKTKYPAPKSGTKIDIARWQLHRAVEALPADAVFNIVVYSESYKVWQDGLVKASKGGKRKAHKFVDKINANGVTNISDPLDKALIVDADTIYLLSDGDPNRGRIADLDRLLDDVTTHNPPGGVVIHTVGIGEAAGSSFLKALAEANGGRYVGYQ